VTVIGNPTKLPLKSQEDEPPGATDCNSVSKGLDEALAKYMYASHFEMFKESPREEDGYLD